MAYDIGPKIGIDGEAEFRAAITNINQSVKTLGTEMKAVTSAYDKNDQSAEKLTAQNEVLNKQIEAQKAKLDKLKEGLAAAAKEFGENDTRTLKWKASVNTATADLNKLERQLDSNTQALEDMDAGLDEAGDGMEDLGGRAEDTGGKLSAMTVAMGNLIADGVKAAASAVGDLVSSLLNLDEATEEYRAAQGKLQTAYEAAGYSSEAAQTAYREFYKILGDTDTAVEASQLLAKLAEDEQDLTKWTEIAAGVSGTFGDSLPIEGLIESANETVKVGKVTGTLADALNWAGISEDAFNGKLAACSDESDRNRLLMETLSTTYDGAAEAFYRNNQAVVAARDAQAALDDSLGRVGEAVANVKTSIQGEFLPSITQMLDGIAALAGGDEGGVEQLTRGIAEFAQTLAEEAPKMAQAGGVLIGALLEALAAAAPSLLEAGGSLLGELAAGITSALPELIPSGTEAVLQLADTLTNPESAGALVDAALGMITALAEGIIGSLPVLARRTPQIIGNIVTVLSQNLPKIGKAALEIILALAAGLLGAIPELAKAVPRLAAAIVGGFNQETQKFRDIGKNIVTGVWTGIQNMGRWIQDKVAGFFSGITSAVKNVLGIHSPSRVYRGIGGNMGESVGIGWEDKYKAVKDQIVTDMDRTAQAAENAAETMGDLSFAPDTGYTGALNGLAEQMEELVRQAPDWGKAFIDGLRQGIQGERGALLADLTSLKADMLRAFSGEMAAAQRRVERSMEQLPTGSAGTGERTEKQALQREIRIDYDALAAAFRRGMDGVNLSMSGRKVGRIVTEYQRSAERARGSGQPV